ncbi:MAG: 4-alpha-glucanotransferase [Deltaproteobacteria bacterium]
MQADAINRLAHAYGIESEYWDIWGKRHEVSFETKQVLLEAMGVPAGDDPSVAASLERLERERWERILDPVMVIRGRPEHLAITIRVPEHLLSTPSTWTLKEEDGAVRNGDFVPSALEIRSWGGSGGAKTAECLLPIPWLPPLGYHRLEVRIGRNAPIQAMTLIMAPERCYVPAGLREGKIFGPAVQLYAIRSRRNWGIGDFTDLKTLVGISADQGAGIVGINPITLLFPENPDHASPYSPSSRLFLNFLYLDVEAVADFGESAEAQDLVRSPEFQARLATLRQEDFVDYQGVAGAKREVLEILYGHFRDRHILRATDRARAFRTFQQRGGETLRLACIFEAIQEHLHREDPSIWGWPVWPEEYRDPASRAVSDFAKENPDRVEFFEYLQWQSDIQLASVERLCLERGLAVGLYQDLPVGVDGAGAETWLNQDLFALGARAGAPPDDFNLLGQDWGLPPFIPHRLREAAYAPFIATLRANMRHAGALRIDHVMILMRLFWVPPGKTPVDGAYVRYPFEDLLGILALESQRNRCLVIGEDLGTVPDELRAALSGLGVLSCRICYFEKDHEGNFKPPEDFPEGAVVSVSTHDLPTLAGYWKGRDIEVRTDLGLFPSEEIRERQIVGRAQDRVRLLLRLKKEGLLPDGMDVQPDRMPEMTAELVTSIHRYLARTPCKILTFQFEDVIGQMDQVNLPGTTDQYQNWRRKLSVELETLAEDARFLALCKALRTEPFRATG